MIKQLQANPDDRALRGNLIKLALEPKTAPAVLEKGAAVFGEGSVVAK